MLMPQWESVRLGDYCSKIGSGATPKGGAGSYLAEGPYSLIRSQNVLSGEFSTQGLAFISESQAHELRGVEVLPKDVLLNITGDSVARSCQVDNRVLPARVNQHVAIVRPHGSELHPDYLRYWFISPDTQAHLLTLAGGGATRNALTKGMIEALKVPKPPLRVQLSIAETLGALDDKIELNRRMNRTLEAMARALFKSWFVDFEPVVAKSEGRPTALPPDLDALFPSEFEDSPGGEIPRGWNVESLDSVAAFLNGLALQKFPVAEGEPWLPVIKIAQLRKGVTPDSDRASLLVPPAYVIGDGDLLFSWSGSLEVQVWTHGRGALNQHLFKVTSDRFEQWFVYHWLLEHLDHFRHVAASKATTMGHIQRSHLTAAQCIVPSEQVLLAANELLSLLHKKSVQNSLEIRDLTRLRDDLLPRLLSGEVEVCDPAELDVTTNNGRQSSKETLSL